MATVRILASSETDWKGMCLWSPRIRSDQISSEITITSYFWNSSTGLLQLPTLPHTAAGVVGRAEHGGVDLVLHDLLLHVLKIHPPHAVLVLLQGAVDNVVAVIGQGSR